MLSYIKNLSAWPQKTTLKQEKECHSLFNRALILSQWGMYDVSIPLYLKTLNIYPSNEIIHFKLAEDYRLNNQTEKAIIHYRECLKINSEDPCGVSIRLHLIGEMPSINTIPIKYVERLYDQYAPYFEKNLVDVLSYSAPHTTFDLLQKNDIHPKTILDLGCGTGLGVMPYHTSAHRIHGVDISSKMLEEAEKKGIYTHLYKDNIFSYLKSCADQYDLIVALDLLIYIADLEDMVSLIPQRLNDKGVFAFSVQLTEYNYSLGEDCRYSHSHAYLSDIINQNHLYVIDKRDIILRTEYETPAAGAIYICSRLK